MRYQTDKDLRRALEERLRQRAEKDAQPIIRLRKRVVFERCIVRLQQYPESPWVLKGGFALELRLGDMARMTNDMDLSVDLALLETSRGLAALFAFHFSPPIGRARSLGRNS